MDMDMEEEGWDEAEAAAEVAPPRKPVPVPALVLDRSAVLDRFELLFWSILVLMPLASESAVAAAAPDVDVFLRLLVLMS